MARRQDNITSATSQQNIVTLAQPQLAEVTLVGLLANRHHDMMGGWGRPDGVRGMFFEATGSTSIVIPCRVPPGVTKMDVSLLLYGQGRAKLTATTDATGTYLSVFTWPRLASFAEWVDTGGPIDTSAGPGSGRAIIVSATEIWSFQNIDITVDIDQVTTAFGLLAVWFRPVRELRI